MARPEVFWSFSVILDRHSILCVEGIFWFDSRCKGFYEKRPTQAPLLRSHVLKIKSGRLTGSLWLRNPLGYSNLLQTFQTFTFAKCADHHVISALYPARGLVWGSVPLTVPRSPRSGTLQSQSPRAFPEEGPGGKMIGGGK